MRMNKRQEKAIENLYMEMYSQLFIYASNALTNRAVAEEAVQDTFRIACSKADDLLGSENPKGWLVNTLKYVIQNIRRSQSRLEAMLASAFPVEGPPYSSEETDPEFRSIYSGLIDEDEYRLLEMIVLKGYTMLDAAQEFGISLEACKKRVQRAKKKLRDVLEEEK